MRAPIPAMLWEIWRVTRVEVTWRLALGIVAPAAVLVVFAAFAPNRRAIQDFGAAIALVLLVLPHLTGWLFHWRVNSRPGFPLYLLYTRPVRTAVMEPIRDPARCDPARDVVGGRGSDRIRDGLSHLALVRGAAAVAALRVWRGPRVGGIRGG